MKGRRAGITLKQRWNLEHGQLSQFSVRQVGADVDFPPATRAPAVPDKGLKPGVAAPAAIKIASAKPEFRLAGGTPGKQPGNFDRVMAIEAGGGGRRKHTQGKTARTGDDRARLG